MAENNNFSKKRKKSANMYVMLAMLRLSEMGETISTKRIIAETGLNEAHLSRILKEFEEVEEAKRMIVITKDLKDGRFNIIRFTKYGLSIAGVYGMLQDITPERDEVMEAGIKAKNFFYNLIKNIRK